MEKLRYSKGYISKLNFKENEIAIKKIRNYFQNKLEKELNLLRVTAPLFVLSKTGINDDLNGIEKPVNFDIDLNEKNRNLEIVHSLAKWKRLNIDKYGLNIHEGIYTDMNAIRKDEIRDNYHSIYVDQWDYEVIISKEDRNKEFLKKFVNKVYKVIRETELYVEKEYQIPHVLPSKISIIESEDLLKLFPKLSPDERVKKYVKEKKAAFILGIGYPLSDGVKQDGRAPDYDDWKLNGDIFVYNPVLDDALELSSMGIRVDKDSLKEQSKFDHKEENLKLMFQKKVLNEEVPFTLGGGIGQSRLCMFMLKKLHIGEVQSSVWDEKTIKFLKDKGVNIL